MRAQMSQLLSWQYLCRLPWRVWIVRAFWNIWGPGNDRALWHHRSKIFTLLSESVLLFPLLICISRYLSIAPPPWHSWSTEHHTFSKLSSFQDSGSPSPIACCIWCTFLTATGLTILCGWARLYRGHKLDRSHPLGRKRQYWPHRQHWLDRSYRLDRFALWSSSTIPVHVDAAAPAILSCKGCGLRLLGVILLL